jgi:K+-transporting ATPase A subunit
MFRRRFGEPGGVSFGRFKPITDSRLGLDQTRLGGVGFDFLAEMGDGNAKILTVFIAALMVRRTAEYLARKSRRA